MDFVVIGLGIGAFAVLLGLAIRDLGPFVRRIPQDGSMPWAEVAERVAWGRRCRAAGLVVAIAGAALCLVTGISLLTRVSDSTGMWIVLAALLLAILAVGAWAFRYQMLSRAPSALTLGDEPSEETKPAQHPGRKSALAGIRSSRPHLSRQSPDPEPAMPVVEDAAPMGALTVDESGAMRRTPVGAPSDPPSTPPRAPRSAPASQPKSAGGRQSEGQTRNESRTTGGSGQGGDPFRR